MCDNWYLHMSDFPREAKKKCWEIDYVGQKKENVKFAVAPSALYYKHSHNSINKFSV